MSSWISKVPAWCPDSLGLDERVRNSVPPTSWFGSPMTKLLKRLPFIGTQMNIRWRKFHGHEEDEDTFHVMMTGCVVR